MPLQTIYKTLVQSSTLLFTKCHMFKRNDMHMTGYIFIHRNFVYDSVILDLAFVPFTRNLRIDKNYTLIIFMLSGSMQFYSNFQFNMTCIYHKTMPLISNYTHAYSFSHACTLQIINHIKICNSTCNKLFNSYHEIQTCTLKDVFSLQILFSLIKVYFLTLSIQFTFMTDSVW